VNDKLSQILLKVERANKHIRDLKIAITSFMHTDPYKVGAHIHSQTRQVFYGLSASELPLYSLHAFDSASDFASGGPAGCFHILLVDMQIPERLSRH
jgi:hypothetical protein